ncbi:MAG: hypothetical protein M0P61_07215 [Ignavibacteriaceae bacterium]|jgi:hypothetical protein|nr:hypothetical protein [Ignavibacteriaceae bacterium]
MKKLLFLILLIITFHGCGKKFDSPVETKQAIYQVASVATFASFMHTLADSIINPSIEFTSSTDIKRTWIEILSPENENISSGTIYLYDNGSPSTGDAVKGDNIFSTLVTMKNEYINGMYSINYFVEDKTGTTKKVASQTFFFDNGKSNVAPVITNVSVPDTVHRESSFAFNVTVEDSNGLNDIKQVSFLLYRPDGTAVSNPGGGTKWTMYNDGNSTQHGDASASDNIFSYANYFSSTAPLGEWKFEFQTEDRGGKTSSIVSKTMVVIE